MTTFSTIKKLFGITKPKGVSEDELACLKSEFGLIPKVLEDYYCKLGHEKELNTTQDTLLLPNRVTTFSNDNFLVFYVENQCSCVWGIKKTDLKLENPSIYRGDDYRISDENQWKKETKSLTDFFKGMAFMQAMFALEFNSEEFHSVSEEKISKILKLHKEYSVQFLAHTNGIRFFSNYEDSIIVMMGNGEYVFYASRNKERFLEMDKLFNK